MAVHPLNRLWQAAVIGIVLVLALVLAACATVIIPPSAVARPARVAVLDHGHHSSLVMELPDGSMVRYTYGEWDWYVRGQTGLGRAVGTLFGARPAAMGRKRLPGPLALATVKQQIHEGIKDVLFFEVEAGAVAGLVQALDQHFEGRGATMLYRQDLDFDFVLLPTSYWLEHNSNKVVADWLEALGCRVEGAGLSSGWRLDKEREGLSGAQ